MDLRIEHFLGPNGHSLWILFCVQYCLAIIVLGICLTVYFALDLTNYSKNFQPYLDVYICLYVIGIIFFVSYQICINSFANEFKICFPLAKKYLKSLLNFKRPSSATINSNFSNDPPSPTLVQCKTESGKFGLKLGVKTFVVVFVTVILMELIIFIQQKLQENKCKLTKKGLFLIVQLIYVVCQTHFVLKTHKEDIERFSTLAHFGVAHAIATTICTGFLLTAHDCLLKLYYYNDRVTSSLSGINVSTITSETDSTNFEFNFIHLNDSQINSTNNICSLKTYIDRIHDQIKPYSFHLCMLYVHCCATLLCLLLLHLRKKIHKPSSTTNFFNYLQPTAETFSAGAGLSLVVLGIIISVLTVTAENNLYITVFLLFLHLQASGVGLFALYKIADIPCTRKMVNSKNHAIFVIFYFFLTLSGVLKIIAINIDREKNETACKVLETTVEIVDLVQAFVNALLILIGFYVKINVRDLEKNKMPTKILIHLAATNLAAIISSIFSSKTEFSKFVDRLDKSADREDNLFSSEIAWTVIESILVPCEEFYRFFAIVCLIKLHKTWSPDEHCPFKRTRF